MLNTFCFSCGEPAVAMGRQAVPICAECRARGLGGAQGRTSYMIHVKGGRSRGPMGRDEVIRAIAKGRCGPDDSINAVGGERFATADHPDFRTAFIPGSDDDLMIQDLRVEAKGIRRRAVFWKWMGRLQALAVLWLSAGAVWVGSTTRLLMMPETWMIEIEDRVDYWHAILMPNPVFESPPTVNSLPHHGWVSATVPDKTGLALHQGMQGLWWSGQHELEGIRRSFLSAMARSPLDPVPLAGLIEVDSLMLSYRPNLLSEIARAKSRLDVMEADGPYVASAEGALYLAQGQWSAAGMATERCAKTHPACRLIHGEAVGSVKEIEQVIAEYGDSPRAKRALARTALKAKDWTALGRAALALSEEFPNDPSGFEKVAEYHAAIGDWGSAASFAEAALERGSERADMAHIQASVAFANREDIAHVVALYDRLVEHPNMGAHTDREGVLLQSAQAKIEAGDFPGARTLVDAAIDAHEASVNAQVLLADLFHRDGQNPEAETVLRQIDVGGIDRFDARLVHLWVGRLYFEIGRHRMGKAELEQIMYNAADWGPYLEEQAWAQVAVEDIAGATSTVEEMAFAMREDARWFDPRENGGLILPERRELLDPMLDAMEADVRHEPKRESVEAILSWWYKRPGHLDQLYDAMEDHGDQLALNAALARASFEAGEWAAAAEQALVVIGRKPSSNMMHSVRGLSLAKLGQWNEGVDSLRRSVRGDTVDTGLLCAAALAWIDHGDLEQAETLLQRAKKSSPKDARVRLAMLALRADKK